jgi:hypothetical protein
MRALQRTKPNSSSNSRLSLKSNSPANLPCRWTPSCRRSCRFAQKARTTKVRPVQVRPRPQKSRTRNQLPAEVQSPSQVRPVPRRTRNISRTVRSDAPMTAVTCRGDRMSSDVPATWLGIVRGSAKKLIDLGTKLCAPDEERNAALSETEKFWVFEII